MNRKERVYRIAAEYSYAVEKRGDLEARDWDREDYLEVSVWALEAMLLEAFRAGHETTEEDWLAFED